MHCVFFAHLQKKRRDVKEVRPKPCVMALGTAFTLSLSENFRSNNNSKRGTVCTQQDRNTVFFLFYDQGVSSLAGWWLISGYHTLDNLLDHILVFVLMFPQLQQLESLFLWVVSLLYPLQTLCIDFGARQVVHQDTEPVRGKLGRNSKPEERLLTQGDI